MAAMMVIELPQLVGMLEQQMRRPEGPQYPFYAVLLYAPINGLDGRIDDYVDSHFELLNSLTGENCLLVAVKAPEPSPSAGGPTSSVYEAARMLSVSVEDMPALVVFSNPGRKDIELVRLGDILESDANDGDITKVFRTMQAAIDRSVDVAKDERLRRLQHHFNDRWRTNQGMFARLRSATSVAAAATVQAGSVIAALQSMVAALGML
jgi:hypothetical protein